MTASKNTDDASSFQQPLLSDETQPPTPQYVIVLTPYPPPHRHRLLRKSWRRCLFCSATSVLFLLAAAYLLWPSDPELSIVRLRLERLRFHTLPRISVDATLDLTVRVRNKDFYAMDYDQLIVAIGYRGKRLGFVNSEGGRIKARGTSYANATLKLERVEIMSDAILLIEDLAKGAVAFDTESEISGELGLFFVDLPLKTKIKCEVLVNTRTQRISRQSCFPEVTEVSERSNAQLPDNQ